MVLNFWLKEQIKKLNQNVILTGVYQKKNPEILHKSDCLLITLREEELIN